MGFDRARKPRQWAEYLSRNAERIAQHKWAVGAVFLIELAGCTIIPLPVALVMVAMVTAAPRKWLRFALAATTGSAFGGAALYIVGRVFFHTVGQSLISFYGSEARWAGVVDWFNGEWGISFVLLAGATTGLFRAASLGAGFTAMNPLLFLAMLCASRCVRWIAECAAIKFVGERVRAQPRHYFKYATLGAAIAFLATLIVVTLAS